MHLPRKTAFTIFFTAFAAVSTASALGSEGLSSAAGALGGALGNLETAVSGGGMGFGRFGSATKQIERARVSAVEMQRVVASGGSRDQVGPVMNQLRGGIESMRAAVVQSNPSSEVHSALRAVDTHYGAVVRLWQQYHGGGSSRSAGEADDLEAHPRMIASDAPPGPAAPAVLQRPVVKDNTAHLSGSRGAARASALAYLSSTYHVSQGSIRVQDVLDLGNRQRVTAYVNGHLRAIDLSGTSGTIFGDVLVN
ncbi:MAG TPA: hypothetical protein VGH90_05265 [Chthoniobacteraceae bacterium]|jgi:hypothetical protein